MRRSITQSPNSHSLRSWTPTIGSVIGRFRFSQFPHMNAAAPPSLTFCRSITSGCGGQPATAAKPSPCLWGMPTSRTFSQCFKRWTFSLFRVRVHWSVSCWGLEKWASKGVCWCMSASLWCRSPTGRVLGMGRLLPWSESPYFFCER